MPSVTTAKRKPSTRKASKPSGITTEQRTALIAMINDGARSPMWKYIVEKFTTQMHQEEAALLDIIPVGNGAAEIARAQGRIVVLRSVVYWVEHNLAKLMADQKKAT